MTTHLELSSVSQTPSESISTPLSIKAVPPSLALDDIPSFAWLEITKVASMGFEDLITDENE